MPADLIDLLFTSGATISDGTATVPCDYYDQDTTQQEGDYMGLSLNSKTVIFRADALAEVVDGEPLTITDALGTETVYTVAGAPRRIQDGKVLEVNLRVRRNG